MTETTVSLAPAAHIHGLSSEVRTRFGKFAVEPPGVFQFAEGLPGFEQNRGFVLLSSRNLVPLRVLHEWTVRRPRSLRWTPGRFSLVIARRSRPAIV